ncbi:MAG: META domain-containing protein [Patescibacteria group bacterium]
MTPRKFFVGRAVGLIVILILVGGFFLLNEYIYREKQGDAGFQKGYKDITYTIEGRAVTLTDGVSEIEAAPGSASKIVTKYFGNEAEGDLNGDGISDIVFLLTQEGGGSGTFFYLVGAIKTDTGYEGTEAVLIGDRIAPQTTEYRRGVVIVNYADRERGEPMTAEPTVAESLHLKYNAVSKQFGELVPEFEGEADPDVMKLDMKVWLWIEALYNDERMIKPKQKEAFTLEFLEFGRFAATTDCNQLGGNYTVGADGAIIFSDMVSTKKYCEGSQEGEFAELLKNTSHYKFTSRGELILDLKFDSGTVIFR